MPRRKVIEARMPPHHTNPISTACQAGQHSLLIRAVRPGSEVASVAGRSWNAQVTNAFRAVRRVMEEAGGTVSDIGKVTVYLRDMQLRDLVNREWLKMFPMMMTVPSATPCQCRVPGRAHPG